MLLYGLNTFRSILRLLLAIFGQWWCSILIEELLALIAVPLSCLRSVSNKLKLSCSLADRAIVSLITPHWTDAVSGLLQ